MKKYPWVLVILFGGCLVSCNNKGASGPSATTQKNLDAVHGITNAFDSKDFSRMGDYVAMDAVDHSGDKGDIRGLDSMKAEYVKSTASVDNPKTETLKELADDEYVMSWNRYTGTYTKDGSGHKAGDKYNMTALEIEKFKDGKVTDHWTLMEPSEMMKMMSNMQSSQMPMMGMDSTKKK
jgi:hypothetical protein